MPGTVGVNRKGAEFIGNEVHRLAYWDLCISVDDIIYLHDIVTGATFQESSRHTSWSKSNILSADHWCQKEPDIATLHVTGSNHKRHCSWGMTHLHFTVISGHCSVQQIYKNWAVISYWLRINVGITLVFRHCCLGDRKIIWPVKMFDISGT